MGLAIVLTPCTFASETELVFTLSNDFLTATRYVDDVYTMGIGLAGSRRAYTYAFYENMFTDRDNDTRFDETYLTVTRRLPEVGGWRSRAGVGVVHVGKGLFGEKFQSLIHGILNNADLELEYVDSGWHATAGFETRRDFPRGDRRTVGPWFQLYGAFGFKWHVAAGGALDWRWKPKWLLLGRLGARYSGTDFQPLDSWVHGLAPTGEAGIRYKKFLTFRYTYNEFGTEDQHSRLDFRWEF